MTQTGLMYLNVDAFHAQSKKIFHWLRGTHTALCIAYVHSVMYTPVYSYCSAQAFPKTHLDLTKGQFHVWAMDMRMAENVYFLCSFIWSVSVMNTL